MKDTVEGRQFVASWKSRPASKGTGVVVVEKGKLLEMMTITNKILPDRFQVLEELGRGGSSVVFRALDEERNREVAVKLLLKNSEEDRFRREARQLATLSHPNVVSFLEVGSYQGQDFLVMEYLEMGELSTRVRQLSLIEILKLFIQICDGLAHLHDKGIIHRDLKPANILMDSTGRPKITDLGVARRMEQSTHLTQAGTILGTYSYLAPEQILSSNVGPKADLYSLGVCLFAALTGRNPFEAKNQFAMLRAHLEESPPSLLELLPEAPPALCSVVETLLAKEAEDRPSSAREVADTLGAIVRELESLSPGGLALFSEESLEELPDDERSVLLAITFLGENATTARVGRVAFFSEEKTGRCLEKLLERRMVDSPTGESFSLNFCEETVETRLTPRVRRLFAERLQARDFYSRMDWHWESSGGDDEEWLAVVESYHG